MRMAKIKDYEIKFTAVQKLDDGKIHLLEWTVASNGFTKESALFSVGQENSKYNNEIFNLENFDLSAVFHLGDVLDVVSNKKVKNKFTGVTVTSKRICI